ncbi:MAG: hypothetical protein P8123_10470 [bacterium]
MTYSGVLDDLVLIGSWCIYLYGDYFDGLPFIDHTVLRTRDMDFLVKDPLRIKNEVNIPELVKDLGFVMQFTGAEGNIRLDHPDLILEFLIAEKGKGRDKPFAVPKLGVKINFHGLTPVVFAATGFARLPKWQELSIHGLTPVELRRWIKQG